MTDHSAITKPGMENKMKASETEASGRRATDATKEKAEGSGDSGNHLPQVDRIDLLKQQRPLVKDVRTSEADGKSLLMNDPFQQNSTQSKFAFKGDLPARSPADSNGSAQAENRLRN